ncbi:MAG: hypothetical protein ACYCW6_30150, partial [Candidatus Xenobia bacterium]
MDGVSSAPSPPHNSSRPSPPRSSSNGTSRSVTATAEPRDHVELSEEAQAASQARSQAGLQATRLPHASTEERAGAAADAGTGASGHGTSAAPSGALQKDLQHIRDVANISDPLERNRAITQTYHDQSERMGRMLGGRVNWETMAQHASAEVRKGINGDDVPGAVKWALNRLPGGQNLMAHSKKELADGNKQVFQDIAPQYARFVDTFEGATHRDDARFQRFLDGMGPDQQLLKDGFRNYYNAMFENDPKQKDEDVLLGNLQISLRDQSLLQPYIAGAIPSLLRPYATSNLIHLDLPNQTLSVGQDVPPSR